MDPEQKETLLMELYENVDFAAMRRPRDQLAYIVDKYLMPGHQLEVMLAITESRLAEWKETHNGKSAVGYKAYHEQALKMLEELERDGGDAGLNVEPKLQLHQAEDMYSKAIEVLPVTQSSALDKVTLHQERAMVRYRLGCYDQALSDVAVAYHYSRATKQDNQMELKRLTVECMFGSEKVDDVEFACKVINYLDEGDRQIDDLVTLSLHDACTSSNQLYNNGFSLTTDEDDEFFRYLLDNRMALVGSFTGRHALVQENIEAGSIILVEKPYSAVVVPDCLLATCNYCLKELGPEEQSYPCDYCNELRFCSMHCSVEAYVTFHRHECGFLGLVLRQCGLMATHVYRIVRQVGLDRALQYHPLTYTIEHYMGASSLRTKANYHLTDADYLELYKMATSLPDGIPQYSPYETAFRVVEAVDLALVLLATEQNVLQEGAYELRRTFLAVLQLCYDQLGRVEFNGFDVYGDSDRFDDGTIATKRDSAMASCLFLVASIFKHGSSPNVDWQFQNGHIVFKTTRKVAQGEELTVDYCQ